MGECTAGRRAPAVEKERLGVERGRPGECAAMEEVSGQLRLW